MVIKNNYLIIGIIVGIFFAGIVVSYLIFGQGTIAPYSDLRELQADSLLYDKDFQDTLISKIMNHDEIREQILQEIKQSEKYLNEFNNKINFEN